MTIKSCKRLLIALSLIFVLSACSSGSKGNEDLIENANDLTVDEIIEKAKEEGKINSLAMPGTWANWQDTWDDLEREYGLKHFDTDMTSAEEIAKFEAEKDNASGDIGDVGISFGPLAAEKGLTIPYKTSYWEDVPDWAKDDEGHWLVAYTGTLAFITDKDNVSDSPTSWDDLKNGDYVVSVGDVLGGTQSQFAVLGAALAYGGDEGNIQPGIDFFAELAKQGRLSGDPNIANLEKGEIDVGVTWDFNALGFRNQIDETRFDVVIPEEPSPVSGYTTIINRYGKNPYSAILAREYILSDAGQNNLAKGYARPIRENAELSTEAKDMLLPDEMYQNLYPIKDNDVWEASVEEMIRLWQEEVLVHVN